MRPVVIGGDVWGVLEAEPGDPALTDRTGRERLATTDPATRTVHVVRGLRPPLLDRVVLHEMAHAVTVSHGLLGALRKMVPGGSRVAVEEWAAGLVEGYGLEAAAMASEALGRPVCVDGRCYG